MATFNARHACPGRCDRRIIPTMLACGPCWLELPQHLRDAITKADDMRAHGFAGPDLIRAHRQAVTAALAWYRRAAHTKETTES